MIYTIFIAIASLIGLVILHELGHFIAAKKFGIKVEEFGIGYPPRIFGKKIGETIYSLNLLPFGAFVKIYGEDKEIEDSRSFSQKPIWQRAIIIFAGVLTFWIIAVIIFSIVFMIGVPTAISDQASSDLLKKATQPPKVLISGVSADSPAQGAGIQPGDRIIFMQTKDRTEKIEINKVNQIQVFTGSHKGEKIILGIKRGNEEFDVSLTPRVSPPSGEGSIGVALVRATVLSYPWYIAPLRAIQNSAQVTYGVIYGLGSALFKLIRGQETGVQVMGPVGITKLVSQHFTLGINYFLQFIAVISIYLAIFNLLPIPAVDGGRLLFLGIEKLKGSPINRKIEQNINAIFFTLLVGLMIWVTIKDITNLIS